MEEISGSSHHGQAEPAAAAAAAAVPVPVPAAVPVPAQVKMSAGEIVKLLPSLSPSLSQALLRFLQGICTGGDAYVILEVSSSKVEAVLEQVCEGFAAELEAVAAVEEGSSSDVILQLSFCLLLALLPSLPNARQIQIWGADQRTYGGEQAVEVLYSALVSQHWSNAVRGLSIRKVPSCVGPGPLAEAFGTDRACEHLAHLLQSGHCKLQELKIFGTGMGAGGMRHIARALETNSSLTVLSIQLCEEVGDGGVEQVAAMLRTNSTLEELTLSWVGMTAHGLGHLCDALSTQQSLPATSSSPTGTMPNGRMAGLKKLDISWNKEIGEGGAAHLGAMLANNRCLRELRAHRCSVVEEDGEGHLAKGLRENSTLEELDISRNKQLGKVALGLLVRCLATNNTSLIKLDIGNKREMPAAEELAHMITYNHSLVKLGLLKAPYNAGEWATVILPALGRNKTLLSIDLDSCQGVKGQQVRDALFDLLRINTTIQEINLHGTTLQRSGEAEAVEVELRRNKVFRDALSGLPRAKPKSCRIVLCGHAYAGKSTLFQSMKLLQPNSQATYLTMSWQGLLVSFLFVRWLLFSLLMFVFGFLSGQLLGDHNLKDKQLSARTRGIEIHLLKDEEDCRISVWDLAGQREFHALHDFMFPSGDNAATLFVLTLSPIVSPADERRAGEVKRTEELEVELLYWLRFIASNSKPSATPPTVVVVFTHKDTLLRLGTHEESWLLLAQDIIADLVAKFSGRVKVEPRPSLLNARASQDVELRRWAEVVEKTLRSTLDGLKEEPAICNHVLRAVQDVSRTGSNSPIISTTEFANICSSEMVAEMENVKEANKVDDEGPADSQTLVGESEAMDHAHKEADIMMQNDSVAEDSEVEDSGAEDSEAEDSEAEDSEAEDSEVEDSGAEEAVEHKIGRAVAAYLHDAGEVIHHDKLDMIVSNPRWFGHGVLGQLIDIFNSSQGQASRPFLSTWCRKRAKGSERPKNGFVTRSYLSHLLKEAVKSVPGLDPTVVTPDQLIQLMLLLDLCCEQTPNDPNTDYFLPAIFDDEGNRAADGKRPLTWRTLEKPALTFVGRRLQCKDLQRTFLTDGFFPRLQVVLHNYAFKMNWVKNRYSSAYMLAKNLFSIWVNGIEILIEFSGSTGYFVDILVKSSKSQQQTMEFLRPNIIGTIRTFCASQEGCQGVTLAEAIIRPDCLYKANGGNPILCTYRSDQSILVEDLAEKMKLMPDYEHCWDKVEDGAGGLVLNDSQDLGQVLLDGPKDVAPGHGLICNQVEETCYANANWKQGKARGLALIVSMEKGRPGGEVDRGRLEALALACGFRKVVLVDPVAPNLAGIINSVVEEDVLEQDECFLCSISGHGGTEDGKPFILDQEKLRIMLDLIIVDPFRQSKHLRGKPKIFLINCCRGDTLYDNSDSVEANANAQQVTGSLLPHVTELSDCLRVFSTSEGCPSCRDAMIGTVFVNQLMETMMENKETTDVLSMMTMVNERVNEVQSNMEDPKTKTKVKVGQCCEVRHTLRKRLYWRAA